MAAAVDMYISTRISVAIFVVMYEHKFPYNFLTSSYSLLFILATTFFLSSSVIGGNLKRFPFSTAFL